MIQAVEPPSPLALRHFSMRRSTILFGIMCAILGATWIPVKAGVSAVPPALFAGTRFLAAGALLALALRGAGLRIRRADLPRLAGVTVLMVVLTYPLLFWGATRVGSGLAAVINLASLPVALLAIAVALDEEPWSARRAGAIGCGVLGLALLFAPRIAGGVGGAAGEAAGAAAILLSALAYALGSVAARPLLRAYRPGWSRPGPCWRAAPS